MAAAPELAVVANNDGMAGNVRLAEEWRSTRPGRISWSKGDVESLMVWYFHLLKPFLMEMGSDNHKGISSTVTTWTLHNVKSFIAFRLGVWNGVTIPSHCSLLSLSGKGGHRHACQFPPRGDHVVSKS